MNDGARGPERGQVAVMFALVFGLVLVGLAAVVGDLLQVYATAGRFDNGALTGAQAGASQVDIDALRGGDVVLDPTRAEAACVAAAAATAGVTAGDVECRVDSGRRSVTAVVRDNIPLVLTEFGPTFAVSRTHTGTIGVGQSRANHS